MEADDVNVDDDDDGTIRRNRSATTRLLLKSRRVAKGKKEKFRTVDCTDQWSLSSGSNPENSKRIESHTASRRIRHTASFIDIAFRGIDTRPLFPSPFIQQTGERGERR